MPAIGEDRDRNVIPRWRDFHDTHSQREVVPFGASRERTACDRRELDRRLTEWKEHRSLSFAADVAGTAITLGLEDEAADAAELILSQCSPGMSGARTLARKALGRAAEPDDLPVGTEELDELNVRFKVHTLRQRLSEQPRNSFLWLDLARAYEILGQRPQAERALRPALILAPENRLVLRSAARLYVHHDDLDRAQWLLQRSGRVTVDPWVLAAEVAIATAARRTSKHVKRAKSLLSSKRYSPFHLSELASAIGKLEYGAGSFRRARRFIRKSLEAPTENSLAQAAWVGRKLGGEDFGSGMLASTMSAEAQVWIRYHESKWREVADAAVRWFADQPFSSRPPTTASFVLSAILRDYRRSARVARLGLLANPRDFTLQNNLAFAEARGGEVQTASEVFARIDARGLSDPHRTVWLATGGLLAYRSGRPQEGRHDYLRAIQLAQDLRDARLVAMAQLCLAMEELRILGPEADGYKREALAAAEKVNVKEVTAMAEHLRRLRPGDQD